MKKNMQKILAVFCIAVVVTESLLVPLSTVFAQEASSSATPTDTPTSTPTPTPEPPSQAILDLIQDIVPTPTPSPMPAETLTPTPTPTTVLTPTPTTSPSPVTYEHGSTTAQDLLLPTETSSMPPTLDTSGQTPTSGRIHTPARVLTLTKQSFGGNEPMVIDVSNDVKGEGIRVELLDSDGLPIPVRMAQTDTTDMTEYRLAPKDTLIPGKYTVKVYENNQVISTQNFLWGVLAINTDKSIYERGETAHIAMAVLDEKGDMVCDAVVTLEIIDPLGSNTILYTSDGTIRINPTCTSHDFTITPDYETYYRTWSKGTYTMKLTAATKNGSYSVTDTFEAQDAPLFDVIREEATRIFPPYTYPVRLHVTARQDFSGEITETVPADFDISELADAVPYATVSAVINDPYRLISTSSGQLVRLRMPFDDTYPTTLEYGEQLYDANEKSLYAQFGLAGHDGVDFGLPEDTPVFAVDDGTVARAESQPYGLTVILQHEWGRSYYGHFRSFAVQGNQLVKKGDLLGYSGHTGLATGPHLHLTVYAAQAAKMALAFWHTFKRLRYQQWVLRQNRSGAVFRLVDCTIHCCIIQKNPLECLSCRR